MIYVFPSLDPQTIRLSECGDPQTCPSPHEIDGCREIIVRNCAVCGLPLRWGAGEWLLVQ